MTTGRKRIERSASDPLSTLLGSRTRAGLLTHFVLHPGEEFHVRELARRLGFPAGNLLRDLRRLEAIGVVEARRAGNQVRYMLIRTHPLYEDLQRLILKTSGAGVVVADALAPIQGVEIAFIYGSFVKGEANARSDIDVMVIGPVTDEVLAPAMAGVERNLGRAISYTRYTRREASVQAGEQGSFLQSVLAGPKIMLVGSQDDELFRLNR